MRGCAAGALSFINVREKQMKKSCRTRRWQGKERLEHTCFTLMNFLCKVSTSFKKLLIDVLFDPQVCNPQKGCSVGCDECCKDWIGDDETTCQECIENHRGCQQEQKREEAGDALLSNCKFLSLDYSGSLPVRMKIKTNLCKNSILTFFKLLLTFFKLLLS